MRFLDFEFAGNSVSTWLTALTTAFLVFFVVWIVRSILVRRLTALAEKRDEIGVMEFAAEMFRKINLFIVAVFALYFGSRALYMVESKYAWFKTIAVIALIVQLGIWANAGINFWFARYKKAYLEKDASRVSTVGAMIFIGRIVLFSIIFLLALDNIPGVEVDTLLASLGVGGIAVALAVQNVLADLFASLSISLDKPFVIGDFIIVDNYMGSIEHVGLKTTRVRSLSGEQLVFANNDLLNSRIRNYKRMYERRVVFAVGVTYQTSSEQLRKIPLMIRGIIESQERTRFDRAHFKEFGDCSLNFEIVYYMLTPDYNTYMDIQEAINLAIYEQFEDEGIEFAYPTQTLFFGNTAEVATRTAIDPTT